MPEQGNRVRAHLWVTGRVQGVGFRAHVEYLARQIRIVGWVRNVGYDTVETIAEGERAQVERFIDMVKLGPSGARVDNSRLEWESPTGEFGEFGVKRSL
jgi:acylphosphatase